MAILLAAVMVVNLAASYAWIDLDDSFVRACFSTKRAAVMEQR